MNKVQIYNTLAWIFIIIGVILLIWRIFGDSPIVDGVLITLTSGLFFKVMTIGERLVKVETRFNNFENSFIRLAKDFKEHIKK